MVGYAVCIIIAVVVVVVIAVVVIVTMAMLGTGFLSFCSSVSFFTLRLAQTAG